MSNNKPSEWIHVPALLPTQVTYYCPPLKKIWQHLPIHSALSPSKIINSKSCPPIKYMNICKVFLFYNPYKLLPYPIYGHYWTGPAYIWIILFELVEVSQNNHIKLLCSFFSREFEQLGKWPLWWPTNYSHISFNILFFIDKNTLCWSCSKLFNNITQTAP